MRRQIGDRWGMATGLDHLGHLSREMREREQARQLYQESLIISQESGYEGRLSHIDIRHT